MVRPKTRRSLCLESLESRSLLSSGGPTNQQQYMLELINMARTQPTVMATWIQNNIDANDTATMAHYGDVLSTALAAIGGSKAIQPLAWSDTLASTAQEQSQYEADNQTQTHQGPGEADLSGRLAAVGYTNPSQYGENSYAYAQSVDHAMKAFLIDWGVPDDGHRDNLLQPGTPDAQQYTEVGIGIVATQPGSSVGPNVITQDFGRPANFQPQVVGVVYDDSNGNKMYDVGEGQGGVTIVVDDMNGNFVDETTTWGSGGYQIPLGPGSYNITAIENGQVVQTQQGVQIGGDNVEVDFDTSQPWQGGTLPNMTNQSQATTPPVTTASDSSSLSSNQSSGATSGQGQTSGSTSNQSSAVTSSQGQSQNSDTASNTGSTYTPIVGTVGTTTDSSWLSGWSWWRKS